MTRLHWFVLGAAIVCLAAGVALGDSIGVRVLTALAGVAGLVWAGLQIAQGEKQAETEASAASAPSETPAPPEPAPQPLEEEVEPEPIAVQANSLEVAAPTVFVGEGTGALESHPGALNRFMASGPSNIVLLNDHGIVLECSDAFSELAGITDAPINVVATDLFEDDAKAAVGAALSDFIADGALPDDPLIARLGSGPKETCAVIFSNLQAEPRIIALSLLNVTQEKKLEAQFAQSQKMLAVGQLAGGVAHDFNNLLTAIIGHCDLLMLRHSPSDESFADINQVKQNANRAANLVRQLLAFSRQQTLQPQVMDVGEVLAELDNLLRRLLGASIDLNTSHGRDLALVKVDRVQLEQVLINLAVNARDAMDGHGALEIVTKMAEIGDTTGTRLEPMPAGDYVQIDVRDKGDGIAKEHLKRIFEPFFTTKDVGKGTGLGLSTVYGIMKQTGGFIFVDSEVGEGTTFSLYLPPHEAEVIELQGAVAAKPLDLTGVGTVMLVEDEDPVRLFGARALRGKGYRVIEATTGGAALKLFQEGEADEIDLLVTDIVMPELDGPSLIAEARKFRPSLPVICVSGYAESEFRDKLDGLQDVHFLPKPFTLQELAGAVKQVIP
jgi:two-component system cell cycle sensor histidine kinase/response regulator CckA